MYRLYVVCHSYNIILHYIRYVIKASMTVVFGSMITLKPSWSWLWMYNITFCPILSVQKIYKEF
jgi:hypothetical protein